VFFQFGYGSSLNYTVFGKKTTALYFLALILPNAAMLVDSQNAFSIRLSNKFPVKQKYTSYKTTHLNCVATLPSEMFVLEKVRGIMRVC